MLLCIKVVAMNIEARKYQVIQQVMKFDETELKQMEDFLDEEFDHEVEREMVTRALQSEKDIEEGKVFTIKEAEERIQQRLGV